MILTVQLSVFLAFYSFIYRTSARCPIGSVQGPRFDDCYYLHPAQQIWSDARDRCKLLGGDLVSIHDAFTNTFLRDQWGPIRFFGDYWTGGRTEDGRKWTWTDGSTFDFTAWDKGEPRSKSGPACLSPQFSDSRDFVGGRWNASDCSTWKPFVCKLPLDTADGCVQRNSSRSTTHVPPTTKQCGEGWSYYFGTDKCYKVLNGKVSWNGAFSTCEEWDGELATIHSADEDAHVMSLINGAGVEGIDYVAIGVYDPLQNNNWTWVDGSRMNYANWYEAPEPSDNPNQAFYCGFMYGSGRWFNYWCDYTDQPAVCQRKPR
ncbi:CLEC-50 protein [Aphelenchoides avenae]|nr:CLEC-50 protein [Aphelenchus avenae]